MPNDNINGIILLSWFLSVTLNDVDIDFKLQDCKFGNFGNIKI
jgi:hypothetical protein